MTAIQSTPTPSALAARGTSAMFLSFFGGLWLEVGAWRSGAEAVVMAGIACVTLALFTIGLQRYRRHAPALAQVAETPERRRMQRVFHTVNGAQWFVIVVLGNVMANIGLGNWVIPMAISVIGLHFVPLAALFHNRAHYATALAMVGFAIAYPLLATDGPRDPVGFYGAGLILWLSAAWSLRPGALASGAALAS